MHHHRGTCQPIPTASPALGNSISASPIPLPLLAIGAVALAAWGLQKSSDYGRQKRIEKYRPPAALPGGHVGQEALYPSEPTSDEPWNGGVLPGSGSFSADQGSMGNGPQSGFTEPCPWSATEAQKSAYVDDRTGSDMSTADVWMVLKDCTFQEFQKRIRPGNVDPVPVVNDGVGAIAGYTGMLFTAGFNMASPSRISAVLLPLAPMARGMAVRLGRLGSSLRSTWRSGFRSM
jgi:hypothetical protein